MTITKEQLDEWATLARRATMGRWSVVPALVAEVREMRHALDAAPSWVEHEAMQEALRNAARARAEEREACALVCERIMADYRTDPDPDHDFGYVAAKICLDGIRARGKPEAK